MFIAKPRPANRTTVLLCLALLALSIFPARILAADGDDFNRPGNILISDQFNNRVIEIDRQHHIVWQFGDGSNVAGPHSVVGVNDAQRVGTLTLISGTGIPAGATPDCPAGCADNRVFLVNRHGEIIWQYGQAGVTGFAGDQLNTPVQATYLPNGHVLISDQGNARVIEVTKNKKIVWQYGMTNNPGIGPGQLNNPNSAELLENGHVLIADEVNNRVIEVTHTSTPTVVWQYPAVPDASLLNGAAFASRLSNANTLITDSGNNRIIEVTHSGNVVFLYATNTRTGSVANPNPTRAVRTRLGNTLISDQFNNQVIEINATPDIIFTQGQIAVSGAAFDQLNAPYDAKVIGDYTGLTPPFDNDHDADNF
jgi:outer membrane protein assembly factor BamB